MGGGYFGGIYFGQYSTGAPLEDIDARRVLASDVSAKRAFADATPSRVITDVTGKRTVTEV